MLGVASLKRERERDREQQDKRKNHIETEDKAVWNATYPIYNQLVEEAKEP